MRPAASSQAARTGVVQVSGARELKYPEDHACTSPMRGAGFARGGVMGSGRLEAFSDGVLAIIITIMVLEMKAPHGASLADLWPLLPVFLSYVLSFVYLGIYWNNHHHMLHVTERVNGAILWANLHLLFPHSFCHGLDGRKQFRAGADGAVRRGSAGGGDRLLDPAALNHRGARRVLVGSHRRRTGPQRQAVSTPLFHRHSGCVPASMDLGWYLRARGADLAHPGPPHRAGSNEARPARGRVASPARDALPKDVAGVAASAADDPKQRRFWNLCAGAAPRDKRTLAFRCHQSRRATQLTSLCKNGGPNSSELALDPIRLRIVEITVDLDTYDRYTQSEIISFCVDDTRAPPQKLESSFAHHG